MAKKKFGINARGESIKRSRKKSQKQEKRLSNEFGARRTVCSGAKEYDKGDLKDILFLYELKHTDKKSFSVRLDFLKKIELEANHAGKQPVFLFTFNTLLGDEDYVIIPKQLFERMRDKCDV